MGLKILQIYADIKPKNEQVDDIFEILDLLCKITRKLFEY